MEKPEGSASGGGAAKGTIGDAPASKSDTKQSAELAAIQRENQDRLTLRACNRLNDSRSSIDRGGPENVQGAIFEKDRGFLALLRRSPDAPRDQRADRQRAGKQSALASERQSRGRRRRASARRKRGRTANCKRRAEGHAGRGSEGQSSFAGEAAISAGARGERHPVGWNGGSRRSGENQGDRYPGSAASDRRGADDVTVPVSALDRRRGEDPFSGGARPHWGCAWSAARDAIPARNDR